MGEVWVADVANGASMLLPLDELPDRKRRGRGGHDGSCNQRVQKKRFKVFIMALVDREWVREKNRGINSGVRWSCKEEGGFGGERVFT